MAELLLAASQLIEAFQTGVRLALTTIRTGSAVYRLSPTFKGSDNQFRETLSTVFSVIERRGEGAPPDARRALLRLVKAGAGYGGVRIASTDGGTLRTAVIAAPEESQAGGVSMTSVMYGEICAVEKHRSGYMVTFRPEGGARVELETTKAMATAAARFFAREEAAAATVRLTWDPLSHRETVGDLISLVSWAGKRDPADLLRWAREQVESAGERIDGAALEAAIFGDA